MTDRPVAAAVPRRTRSIPVWVFVLSLVLAVGAGLGGGALLWAGESPADRQAAEARDQCEHQITVYFNGTDPDPVMSAAADRLRGDARFASVRTQTRLEAWAEFKRIFADEPDLLSKSRPEALPAAVVLMTRPDTTPEQVAPDLEQLFPGAEVRTLGPCSP
ncbi:permease-like cell division protein FtsX [Amycolatopsis sp. NPDC006131]|uniref:permease-like cell division protein FtsX n=1 Tax=Amycolatopsis sp. NPDC006131 TaxID=3156731 RepID=UPI0033A9A3D9